jgi:hypothetical protein
VKEFHLWITFALVYLEDKLLHKFIDSLKLSRMNKQLSIISYIYFYYFFPQHYFVTSGEKGDGSELPELLEISQENGIDVNTVIGDAAYSGKENIKLTAEQNIKIVAKLNPSITQGFRKDEDKFDYNKDADMFVCPAGHMAIRKARQGKKNRGTNQADTYYFDVEKCKTCPLKKGCYKEGAKTKTYSVSIKSDIHTEQIAFQETDYFKEKTKHRYKIEAKNSELKNVHGYGRASSYGITNMQMQGAIAIFTVNLKRIIKLTS